MRWAVASSCLAVGEFDSLIITPSRGLTGADHFIVILFVSYSPNAPEYSKISILCKQIDLTMFSSLRNRYWLYVA